MTERRFGFSMVLILGLLLMCACVKGPSAQAEAYYKKGLVSLEKDKNEALGHFNRTLDLDPRHYMALYLKAVISREFADWGAADTALAGVRKIVAEISENERIKIVQDKWGPYKTGLRVIAVRLLKSPDVLKETLYNDGDKDIREAAVNNPNFSDTNELVRIALDGERCKHDSTARYAVRRIDSQVLLQYIFRHAADYGTQREALLRITDAEALAQIAADHKDPQFRMIAAKKIAAGPSALDGE
jgi:tetratricopeptide (TPR) repeat protein